MAKKKVVLNLPYQLGMFVLHYAKLRMLSLYYNFLDLFVERKHFECLEQDTDSLYLSLSAPTLQETVKPEMQPMFEYMRKGFCSDDSFEADDEYCFFPRTCCSKHSLHDKRTVGLFKLEYEGKEMVGLCSKTYIVVQNNSAESRQRNRFTSIHLSALRILKLVKKRKGLMCSRKIPNSFYKPRLLGKRDLNFKMSCKGINKIQVKNPLRTFRNVLETQRTSGAKNVGFRAKENTIFTYSQERNGFTYFYCKREVLEDGIHTIPLDMTLTPWSDDDDDDDGN